VSGGPNYAYQWTPARPTVSRITTSRTELIHISIAYVVLTFDFVLVFSGAGLLYGRTAEIGSLVTLPLVVSALIATFTAFICHEMAHKIVAQRHGFWAEFRASPFGLVFSVITSALGLLLAAPGATLVGGMPTFDRSAWGRTSLAGPLTNVMFGAIFYAGSVALFLTGYPAYYWLLFIAWANAWLGAFNLIPFGPLDGAKVLRWDPGVWAASFFGIGAFAVALWYGFFYVGAPIFPL